MELWIRGNDGSTLKIQGSLKSIYQALLKNFTDSPKILAFNGSKRERRRFKRELRAAKKDLLKAANSYLLWLDRAKTL